MTVECIFRTEGCRNVPFILASGLGFGRLPRAVRNLGRRRAADPAPPTAPSSRRPNSRREFAYSASFSQRLHQKRSSPLLPVVTGSTQTFVPDG